MSDYLPLPLKYRPRKFSQVLGQRVHLEILANRIKDGKLARVLLVSGPHSSGKTTIARILARRLNCQDPQDENPCGRCRSCLETSHPDIRELNAASERGIDDIRELAEIARLSPTYSCRVFILDEAHSYTPQAWQASLKMFEEPPAGSYFILLTTEAHKVPNAILSRCSRITLSKVPLKPLREHLVRVAERESYTLDQDTAQRIAVAADGHPREALTLLEQVLCYRGANAASTLPEKVLGAILEEAPTKVVPEFLEALLSRNVVEAMAISDTVENATKFLESVTEGLRGVYRLSIDQRLGSVYHNAVLAPVALRHRKVSTEQLGAIFRVFARYWQQARSYTLPDLVCRDLAIVEAVAAL